MDKYIAHIIFCASFTSIRLLAIKRPIIHISSTSNKWIVILDGLYGLTWVQVTTTHNIIARYFLDTLKQCVACVGAIQVP
jgi:hypothetical protein